MAHSLSAMLPSDECETAGKRQDAHHARESERPMVAHEGHVEGGGCCDQEHHDCRGERGRALPAHDERRRSVRCDSLVREGTEPVCCRRGDERGETDATQRLQQGGDPERRVEGDERDEHGAQGEHDAAENGDLASPEPICCHAGGRFEYECGKGSGEQHDAGFEGRVTGTVNERERNDQGHSNKARVQ